MGEGTILKGTFGSITEQEFAVISTIYYSSNALLTTLFPPRPLATARVGRQSAYAGSQQESKGSATAGRYASERTAELRNALPKSAIGCARTELIWVR